MELIDQNLEFLRVDETDFLKNLRFMTKTSIVAGLANKYLKRIIRRKAGSL